MFTRNYYCLVAGLPDIMIDGNKPMEAGHEFKNELREQLHPSDFKLAELLYLQYDNINLLNLLLKQDKEFLNLGKYSEDELEEQIKETTYIVGYLNQFITNFQSETSDISNLEWETQLQSLYYEYLLQGENSFLNNWFRFERDMKNILTAINCKIFDFDKEKQLIPVNNNNEVYDILIKSSPKPDLLSDEVPYTEKIIQIAESDLDITGKEKAFDNLKWDYLDENTFFNYFTIEKILGFVIKLRIVERWLELDDKTGKEFFDKMIEEIKTSYTFDEEFSLKSKI